MSKVYDRYGKSFQVGQVVESVFDEGTRYEIIELVPPSGTYEYSTYLRLKLVSAGVDTFRYGVSDHKGRMADGHSYAPYHFKPITAT